MKWQTMTTISLVELAVFIFLCALPVVPQQYSIQMYSMTYIAGKYYAVSLEEDSIFVGTNTTDRSMYGSGWISWYVGKLCANGTIIWLTQDYKNGEGISFAILTKFPVIPAYNNGFVTKTRYISLFQQLFDWLVVKP